MPACGSPPLFWCSSPTLLHHPQSCLPSLSLHSSPQLRQRPLFDKRLLWLQEAQDSNKVVIPCSTTGYTGQKSREETEPKEKKTHPTKTDLDLISPETQIPRHQYKKKTNSSQGNMLPSESTYPNAASPDDSNTDKAQEKELKTNYVKMIVVLKEDVNKSLP